jgi:hypothetical protein
MTFRALPGRIERANRAAKRCTEWVYYAPHPVAAFDEEDYFAPLSGYLTKTDFIRCLAEAPDGSWDEAVFRVLHSETKRVIVRRITDWDHFGLEIGSALVMVDRGDGKYDVVDTETRRTVKANADLMTAQAIVAVHSRPDEAKRGPGRPRKEAA